jgi:hypothetical protein
MNTKVIKQLLYTAVSVLTLIEVIQQIGDNKGKAEKSKDKKVKTFVKF